MNGNRIAVRTLIGCDIAIVFTVLMTGIECTPLRNAISDLAPIYALVLIFLLPVMLIVVERNRSQINQTSGWQKAFILGSIIVALTFWLLASVAFVSIVVFFITNQGQPVWLE